MESIIPIIAAVIAIGVEVVGTTTDSRVVAVTVERELGVCSVDRKVAAMTR